MEPKVGRYNASLKYNGSAWVTTVQLNTIGNITVTGTNPITFGREGAFKTDKINISVNGFRTAVVQQFYIWGVSEDAIVISPYLAPATGDTIYILIEVFNLND